MSTDVSISAICAATAGADFGAGLAEALVGGGERAVDGRKLAVEVADEPVAGRAEPLAAGFDRRVDALDLRCRCRAPLRRRCCTKRSPAAASSPSTTSIWLRSVFSTARPVSTSRSLAETRIASASLICRSRDSTTERPVPSSRSPAPTSALCASCSCELMARATVCPVWPRCSMTALERASSAVLTISAARSMRPVVLSAWLETRSTISSARLPRRLTSASPSTVTAL